MHFKTTVYHYTRFFLGSLREGFLIKLQTKDNREGWGEIAPLPGFSKETLDDAFNDLLKNNSPCLPSVQWGKASAVLDLTNPLHIESIPISVLGREKIKIGPLNFINAKNNIAESKCVSVDMNQKWTLSDALKIAQLFPSIKYFEEPLKKGERYEQFPYPVALDESLRQTMKPNYPNITRHIIKPTLMGYPLPAPKKGISYYLSSSFESELGLYQIAKLSLRMNLPNIPMGLSTFKFFKDQLFTHKLKLINNRLVFPKSWILDKNKVKEVFRGYI